MTDNNKNIHIAISMRRPPSMRPQKDYLFRIELSYQSANYFVDGGFSYFFHTYAVAKNLNTYKFNDKMDDLQAFSCFTLLFGVNCKLFIAPYSSRA